MLHCLSDHGSAILHFFFPPMNVHATSTKQRVKSTTQKSHSPLSLSLHRCYYYYLWHHHFLKLHQRKGGLVATKQSDAQESFDRLLCQCYQRSATRCWQCHSTSMYAWKEGGGSGGWVYGTQCTWTGRSTRNSGRSRRRHRSRPTTVNPYLSISYIIFNPVISLAKVEESRWSDGS